MDKNDTESQPQRLQPREESSFISKLFFCWSLPLFYRRYKKQVTEDEHYRPLRGHESKKLGDKLEKIWLQEYSTKQNPSLWTALWKMFYLEFLGYGFLFICFEFVIKMSQPWLIGKLMSQYNSTTSVSKNDLYLYSALILLSNFLSVMIGHNYHLHIHHFGMKVRVACCSLIYRKALKLDKTSLAELTVGKMINLLTNDVNRFDLAPMHIIQLFVAPCEVIFVIWCLCVIVGPTAVAGIVFLILFVPLQMYMGKLTARFRSRTAAKTDQRVKLMNEIISGIQVIKMYVWENIFSKLMEKTRGAEIRQITNLSYLRGINTSFMLFMNRTGIFLCILIYALTEEKIDAQYVFVVSSFYAILRQTLTVYFPFGINNFSESRVSVDRIRQFLVSPEIVSQMNDKEMTTFLPTDDKFIKQHTRIFEEPEPVGIRLQNVSVKWLPSSSNYTLRNVSFDAFPNQLVAIVGAVGSGKSTLLLTILQELPLVQGKIKIKGTISYAAQEPWLFSGTIRENILFGSAFDQDKYKNVVNICGLAEDFALFPFGDGSQVGERGVMLSGGQKARIGLARAVYKDADIYLLDDPFAAVDTKVGKEIFHECILEHLKDKCTVLVTHHLSYLGKATRVYKISEGTVSLQEINTEIENEEMSTDNKKENLCSMNLERRKSKSRQMKEERKTGTVSKKIYRRYMSAGGNYFLVFILCLLFILTQSAASGADYFLAFWVNVETSNDEQKFFTHNLCLYFYIGFVLATIVLSIIRSLSFFKFCMKASEHLHNNMFFRIITAPMKFFNTNPSGRILNRFSKDMGLIDETLPVIMMDTFQIACIVLGSTLLVTIPYPWMIFPTLIMITLFHFFRKVFLSTSRNLKRLEATDRSPIYSHLTASLNGLTTIRSYNAQDTLQNEFDHYQDLHTSSFYMFMVCNRAFGFWLDMSCIFYFIVVIASVMLKATPVGDVGLALTQSINLIGVFQWGIKQWSELENQMISVERVVEYADMISEKNNQGSSLEDWPTEGRIKFDSVSLQYSNNGPFVLNGITFEVQAKEKIGIVGRTGAGKSSLIAALFRLFNSEGRILIDGVDISGVSLSQLRSKISIIPQEPTLFTGSLRQNLDPFQEFSDEKIWRALEQVELKSTVTGLPEELYSEIRECGSNFSVGQRQLICLARAILRENKILVLDEATANVDEDTDKLIQKTIKNNFHDCTVLTIAHRLHTIMDSDKVLVLDAGKVVEFGHSYELLQTPGSCFAQLVEESGKEMAENLTEMATKDYDNRRTR